MTCGRHCDADLNLLVLLVRYPRVTHAAILHNAGFYASKILGFFFPCFNLMQGNKMEVRSRAVGAHPLSREACLARVILFPIGQRRDAMQPAARATRPERRGPAAGDQAKTRNIRLTEQTIESWKLWCRVNGMSYEQSVRFFLDAHPIKAEDLKKFYHGVE